MAATAWRQDTMSDSRAAPAGARRARQAQRDHRTVREALRFFFLPKGIVFRVFLLVVEASEASEAVYWEASEMTSS